MLATVMRLTEKTQSRTTQKAQSMSLVPRWSWFSPPWKRRFSIRTAAISVYVGAACVGLGEKLLVLGGHDGVGPTTRVDAYDPLEDSWEQWPQMQVARWNLVAAIARVT